VQHYTDAASLDAIGGDPLVGSGFEEEEPAAEFHPQGTRVLESRSVFRTTRVRENRLSRKNGSSETAED
jgi:hypothetical protein